MSKREFRGDPIDGTARRVKHLAEKSADPPKGDYKGKEMTEVIPDFVNREEYTDEQLRRVKNAILYPDLSLKTLCNRFDHTYSTSSQFFKKFRNNYERELRKSGLYNAFTFGKSTSADETDHDLTQSADAKERVRQYYRKNPDAGGEEVMENVETGDLSINAINGLKSTVNSNDDGDDGDTPSTSTNSGRMWEVEIPPPLYYRVMAGKDDNVAFTDVLERLVENGTRQQPTISEDTAFDIIAGEDLSREQRREIFDSVVSGMGDGK